MHDDAVRVVGDAMEASQDFPRRADQAPRVRAYIRRTLATWRVGRIDDAVLVASELFSNAVLHGGGQVEVRVLRLAGGVRLEVLDEGTGGLPRPMGNPGSATVTGRGLRIVDRLATTWGSGRDPLGRTSVWAEVST